MELVRLAIGLLCSLAADVAAEASPPSTERFEGRISRQRLEHYLARAVTHAGLCDSSPDPRTTCLDDDLRMLKLLGVRFVGRAAFAWHLSRDDNAHFQRVETAAGKVHAALPDCILQACVFEIVSTKVERIPIPAWVFAAFGKPPVRRSFDYEAMLYDAGKGHDHWGQGSSIPDMSRLETRLWFYYRARRYIDAGMEAIHFGQVKLMDDADPGHRHWIDLLKRVRNDARHHARRGLVLCDAHTHGEREDGRLLFDFHSYPLRIREVPGEPMCGVLSKDEPGDIFGRSQGGITPSGWRCEAAPYLVELDNYGYSGRGGESVGGIWVWGYDEISWFAHLKPAQRANWLKYAHRWIRKNAPHGHLQMPTRRILAAPVRSDRGPIRMYHANRRSPACPGGFGVEDTIRRIWSKP